MQASSTQSSLAARQAAARAAACRTRVSELADHRRVNSNDVQRAQAALQEAISRAAVAHDRLIARRSSDVRTAVRLRATDVAPPRARSASDVGALRERARSLDAAQLFMQYFSLGGGCSSFELDAFVHAALELPSSELDILAQAVWEMTEF